MSVKSIMAIYCPAFLKPAFERIENSPLGYRLAKGMFWTIAGAVTSRGLMLCSSVLVSRMLGKTCYGELGMIQSTIGMFGTFAGFGLGITATKHVAELRENHPERAGRIIALAGLIAMTTGGLLALGLAVFAPWLAEHTISAPHLASVLQVGCLILFFSALNGAQTGALSGFEAFRTIAHVNLIVGLISFPIMIAGAYFGGLSGVVWALSINMAINWLLNHLAIRKEARSCHVPLTFRDCGQELPLLWRFALPAVLSGIMVTPVNWACAALLVHQPGGYGEMGIFSAANQWRTAILFLPGLLAQVVLPLLSNLNGQSAVQKYRRILLINIFLNAGVALVVVLPLVLLAHFIMLAYGPEYEQGTNVLRIMAFSAVLMAVNSVVGSAIASKGKMWIGLAFNALWALVLLATTKLTLQWGYGAFGLACATLIAYLLHTAWQSIYLVMLLGRMDRIPHLRLWPSGLSMLLLWVKSVISD